MVAARGGDLKCMAGLGLPDDVGEIGGGARRAAPRAAGLLGAPVGALDDRAGAGRQFSSVVLDELADVVDRAHAGPRDEGGLAGGGGGHDDVGHTGLDGGAHGRQDAAHGMDGAVQSELADVDGAVQHRQGATGQQRAGAENGQGQGQVEPGAGLAQIGRRQVDRQPLLAPCDAAGGQCRAYALARLAHGGVGEPHEGEAGQALARVGLDVHEMALQAGEGHGQGARQAHDAPTPR